MAEQLGLFGDSGAPGETLGSLTEYDLIVLSSSGGKDSQTMIDVVWSRAVQEGVSLDRLVIVHADLGRAEWQGTRELVERQAAHYGIRCIVVERPQGDLLQRIKDRGRWPSPAQRYCTSDLKRNQIARIVRGLCPAGRVLHCMGLRATESPARAKKASVAVNAMLTTKSRHVTDWLPIHDWTDEEVWANIRASGVPYHPAYDLGMPRLSCVFCIFAPRDALMLAGQHNPELLAEYVQLEKEMEHTFKPDLALADVQAALEQSGAPVTVAQNVQWNM